MRGQKVRGWASAVTVMVEVGATYEESLVN